jgi:transposase
MEQLHMNRLRDLINRLRAGESERRIARDMSISRTTVRKYRDLAEPCGYLQPDQSVPDDATLRSTLGPDPQPRSRTAASTVEPYQDVVQRLVDQGVEMTAIYQRLRENHGYTGSYSAIRRYVHRVYPHTPEAVVRVHTAPGEELQVDFGSVGSLYDPVQGHLRPAYVFVATLCYSRHQYADLDRAASPRV